MVEDGGVKVEGSEMMTDNFLVTKLNQITRSTSNFTTYLFKPKHLTFNTDAQLACSKCYMVGTRAICIGIHTFKVACSNN